MAGFVEESPQHRFYNAAFFAEEGRIVHLHRKVYLPTYGLFDEQRYFAAGERIRGVRHGPLRPRRHVDLRGFLAPLGRRDHAGRRGGRAGLRRQFARPAASMARSSAPPRPTSTSPRPSPSCSGRW